MKYLEDNLAKKLSNFFYFTQHLVIILLRNNEEVEKLCVSDYVDIDSIWLFLQFVKSNFNTKTPAVTKTVSDVDSPSGSTGYTSILELY